MGHALRTLARHALDLLYPPLCHHCGLVDWRFCPRCEAALGALACPAVRLTRRRHWDALDGAAWTGDHVGLLRAALHTLKYDATPALAHPLAARLAAVWSCLPSAPNVILPVPLHAKRLRARGYNQAALLAQALAEAVGVPCDDHALGRAQDIRPQVGLDRAARRANVEGAFVTGPGLRRWPCVLLVDDVCTTGATLDACAAALKQAGVARVWALTVSAARLGADDPTAIMDPAPAQKEFMA